jgi:hypothetical protein
MSDGQDGDGYGTRDYVAKENNDDRRAFIFTYALGDSAPDQPLRAIACEHKGSFESIPDGENLGASMSRYYEFLAVGGKSNAPVWSEPYLDCCGEGIITTAARACYTKPGGSETPILIGVAGASVPITTSNQQTVDDLYARSKTCNTVELSDAQLLDLRNLRTEGMCDFWYPHQWELALIILSSIFGPCLIGAAVWFSWYSWRYYKKQQDA